MRVTRWLASVVWSFALVSVVGCQSLLGDFTTSANDDGGVDSSLASSSGASSSGGVVNEDGGASSSSSSSSGSSSGGSSSGASGSSGSSGGSSSGTVIEGGTCDETTCPFGCCLGQVCVPYANQNDSSCAPAGGACAACPGKQRCDTTTGVCGCNATTCQDGCCDATHGCQASVTLTCGVGGASCIDCSPKGQECSAGACVCDATSCPNGCCDSNNVCQTSGQASCGIHGASCSPCGTGQACSVAGACICAPGCTGCCAGGPSGSCAGGTENATCGQGGGTCADCTQGQGQECAKNSANAYVCQCDATSCPNGCCDTSGACQANEAPNCGVHGAACVTGCNAASGQECNAAGACVCDATSCSNGCCTSATGTCVTTRSSTQCAAAGAVCEPCSNASFVCSSAGACGCPTGDIVCGGSCVNPTSNGTYCGASGTCTGATAGLTCTGGETCQSSACACPSGEVTCSSQCTSTQTDAKNCGACGHSCGSGTCSGGVCQRYAICSYSGDTTGSAYDLTVNASGMAGIAWDIGGATGAIIACDTTKTNQTVGALYTLATGPAGITSDATNFYWSNENAGTIVGGPIVTGSLASELTGLQNPVGLAPAGSKTFFYADAPGSGGLIGLFNNGTTSTCISGLSFPYLIGSYYNGTVFSVVASDLSGNAVYLAPSTACGSLTAGPTTIATGVPQPDTAATDGNGVFFGTRGNVSGGGTTPGALYVCPTTGCNPLNAPAPYVANQGSVGRVVLDGTHVIWTGSGGVVECAKTGCTTPTTLDSTVFTNALQAQGGFVYYVSGGTLYGVAE